MGWNKNLPGETNSFADVPQIAQDNFDALEDGFGKEHYTLGEALCGTHIAGGISVVKSAGTSVIDLLPAPGSGAIAWDTTLGYWRRYWNSAWGYPGSGAKWSRVRAYKNAANQNLTSVAGGTQVATIVLDGETYDTLSEFASNTFTALDAGYYLVAASWTSSGAGSNTPTSVTYPQSGVTENWTAFKVRVPTSEVSAQNWTAVGAATTYECVDELGNYDISEYVNHAAIGTNQPLYFNHTALDVPATSTIVAIRVLLYAKSEQPINCFMKGSVRTGTTWNANATSTSIATTSKFYTWNWTTNPATSAAWTVAEVNGTDGTNPLSGFGFLANTTFNTNQYYRVYQAQLVALYTDTNGNYSLVDDSTVDYTDGLIDRTAGGSSYPEIMSASVISVPSDAYNLSAAVTVVARNIAPTSTTVLYGALRCGTTNYYSSSSTALTDQYSAYTFIWDDNPATTSEWTEAQFEGTAANALSGFGLYASGSTLCADIAQIYLTRTFIAPTSTIGILLRKNSTVVASAVKEVNEVGVETDEQIKLLETIYLTAGATLDVQAQRTSTNDVIISGSDATYLAIHRLGSQGL